MRVGLRVKGEVDLEALQGALDSLVERHEVLRTTFVEGEDGPLQVIHEAGAVKVERVDLKGLTRERREEELVREAREEVSRGFDLERDLMLRVKLIELGEQEHGVLFTQHHIASDGWSVAILVREFSQLYEAYSEGRENPLKELAVQYGDYAQWQRGWLTGEVLEAQLGDWKKQLEEAPAVHSLPLDEERPWGQGDEGGVHRQAVDGGGKEGLRHVRTGEGAKTLRLLGRTA